MIQSEGGFVIASNDKESFDMTEMQCMLMNHRNIRDNLKKFVSCHPKMAPLLI